MKAMWMLVLAATLGCLGCTSISLEQYTLVQNSSAGDARDRSVLNCLAAIAADPNDLPSFALYVNGVTSVTDSLTLGHTITAAPAAFTKEALALTGSRSPKGQWTVDPAVEYERLEALQAACWWAIFGAEKARPAYSYILGDPKVLLDNKPHFGVEERLAKIPPGWVKLGRRQDVPPCTRYKAHRGDTWVWVMPEDTESFAQFTLVLEDIATLDPTVITASPLLVQLTTYEMTKLPDTSDKSKFVTIGTSEIRAVKLDHKKTIENAIQAGMKSGSVNLSRAEWLAHTEPWYGVRSATTISAAAPSLSGRAQPTQLNPGIPSIPSRAMAPSQKFDTSIE
jgi:hypothetical protein